MFRPAAIFVLLTTLTMAQHLSAQTSTFNYQGRLTEAGNPANGAYLMQFKLFDAVSGGSQIGSTLNDLPVTVSQGLFSVKLDFGVAALSGANRWLEIAVRHSSSEFYVVLSPREQIASSPYAVRTLSATTAENALALGGIPASDYVTNASVGSSFIRNGTTLQAGNFNISGNGAVGGNLGVGTATPGYKLDVNGVMRAFGSTSNDMLVQTLGGTNAWARFSMQTPSQIWAVGTSQNFNGNQFYLFDTTNSQSRMTVQPAGGAISFPVGNVGIGTTNPASGLEVRGTGLGVQQRITDITSGNSLVLQSGSGSDMKVTGYNYGTGQAVPLYLSVDGALTNVGGNLTQTRSAGGSVKAMVYVNGDGTITRCYNGITGSSSGNCSFSVSRPFPGSYTVDFNFPVDDRFFSVSVQNSNNGGLASDAGVSFVPSSLSNDSIFVQTYEVDSGRSDRPFMIIVF